MVRCEFRYAPNSGIFQAYQGNLNGRAAESERSLGLELECALEFLQAILDKIGRLGGEFAVL
jgi:hypothetical protein